MVMACKAAHCNEPVDGGVLNVDGEAQQQQ